MRIALTSIIVNDPIDAFKFYTETLGFVEKMYMPEGNLAIIVASDDPDGTQILLEPNSIPFVKTCQEGLHKAGLPVIVFEVDDIQEEYERLKSIGVSFTKEPTKTDWGTEAILDDTCGNLIQIYQK